MRCIGSIFHRRPWFCREILYSYQPLINEGMSDREWIINITDGGRWYFKSNRWLCINVNFVVEVG